MLVPPSIATLSDQMSLTMTGQERFIGHPHMLNSVIEHHQRALFQLYDLQFSSFPSFPEGFFHESSSVAVPPSRLSDKDNDDTGDGGGEEAVWIDNMED